MPQVPGAWVPFATVHGNLSPGPPANDNGASSGKSYSQSWSPQAYGPPGWLVEGSASSATTWELSWHGRTNQQKFANTSLCYVNYSILPPDTTTQFHSRLSQENLTPSQTSCPAIRFEILLSLAFEAAGIQ